MPSGLWKGLFKFPSARAAAVFILLLVVGAILQPRSVGPSALLSVMPFMAILGVASIGQHIAIQQRGFDLSVAGIMSLSAVLVTALPSDNAGFLSVLGYVLFALMCGVLVGCINGVIVSVLGVSPIVTTIGTNALLLGATLVVSGGSASVSPKILTDFANGKIGGVPNTVFVVVAIAVAATFTMERTTFGRKFIAVGVSPAAARALAIPVKAYRVFTYGAAGLFFAAAGVLLAGFLSTPSVFCGNDYMLSTVAAVVVGGNSLAGGRGSSAATVIGAAFLTYMGQLVVSLGLQSSAQYVIEAVIIIAGAGLPQFSSGLSRGVAG